MSASHLIHAGLGLLVAGESHIGTSILKLGMIADTASHAISRYFPVMYPT